MRNQYATNTGLIKVLDAEGMQFTIVVDSPHTAHPHQVGVVCLALSKQEIRSGTIIYSLLKSRWYNTTLSE